MNEDTKKELISIQSRIAMIGQQQQITGNDYSISVLVRAILELDAKLEKLANKSEQS